MTATNRSCDAKRLEFFRVRAESTLPPLILHPGDKHSHEVKCFSEGHLLRSVPHSATNDSAMLGPRPWIKVKSVPVNWYSIARTSNLGALACFVLVRGAGSLISGSGRSAFSWRNTFSIYQSQSPIRSWYESNSASACDKAKTCSGW